MGTNRTAADQESPPATELDLLLNGPACDIFWPVRCGIPLVRGSAAPDVPFSLLDPDAREVPCDTRPSVLWPDGSVRWLAMDTIVDLRNVGRKYTLCGLCSGRTSPKPAAPLNLERRLGGELIRSRVLSLVIPHQRPNVIEDVRASGEGGQELLLRGLASTVEEGDGSAHEQSPPDRVEIEHSSPMRSQVLVEGAYSGAPFLYAYRYRITAYADLPLLRLEHTLVNRSADPADRRLRRCTLRFELPAEAPEARFSVGFGRRIHQSDLDELALDGKVRSRRYDGTARIPPGVTVCVADFWQRYPKSIEVAGSALRLGLLDCEIAGSRRSGGSGRSADPGGVRPSQRGILCAQGEAQTTEIWLWLGGETPPLEAMASLVNHRPVLHPSPEAMCASGAFGSLRARDRRRNAAYERAVERGLKAVLRAREDRREYGWRNYGDSRYEMLGGAWLNGEYDWGHAYFLQFARSGDRRYLDLALSCVRHMMDTDIIHYNAAPADHLIGAPHAHSADHTAGDVDLGHAWLEGLFDMAALLDDSRAREHARSMAGFFVRCVTRVAMPRYMDRPGARRPGWGLIALTYAYEHTMDRDYLEAARCIVEICLREQLENGSWVYPGGGLDDPAYLVGKTFMVALTLAGLMRYHRITGNVGAKSAFLRGVDWAVDAMWDEAVGGFRSIDAPFDSFQRSPGSSAQRIMESLWYAFELTGDPRYRYVACRTWRAWLGRDPELLLMPNDIRDVVHYLPHHEDAVEYSGTFPLSSIRPAEPRHIRRFRLFADGRGFAAGLFGLLMATEDRGRSWRRIDTGRSEHLYAVAFPTMSRGLALGEGSEMLLTTDGGRTWSSRPALDIPLRGASLPYFYDLAMVNDRIGYAAGYAVVAKTEDGGRTWSRIWDAVGDGRWDKLPQWRSLYALSPDRVWAVGSYALSAVIQAQGDRVIARPTLGTNALHVTFLNDRAGFVGDTDGVIWITRDAGESWSRVAASPGGAVWQIAFFGTGDGRRTRGDAGRTPADRTGHQGDGDRDASGIGLACGDKGIVLTTSDHGESWTVVDTGVRASLRAVAAFDDRVAVAGGDEGALLRTDDRGRTWHRVDFPAG